jgi:hypothetical protein
MKKLDLINPSPNVKRCMDRCMNLSSSSWARTEPGGIKPPWHYKQNCEDEMKSMSYFRGDGQVSGFGCSFKAEATN